MVFQHYVISNTERYFPKACQFLPERWIGSGSVDAPPPRHAFASLPFGYGRRMCIGRRFAELEILILLGKVNFLHSTLERQSSLKISFIENSENLLEPPGDDAQPVLFA